MNRFLVWRSREHTEKCSRSCKTSLLLKGSMQRPYNRRQVVSISVRLCVWNWGRGGEGGVKIEDEGGGGEGDEGQGED